MKLYITALFCLIFGFSSIANAGSITVNYVETNGTLGLAGSFSGNDSNSDGSLSFNELDAWNISYSVGATLADLNAIGDFNYTTNVWTPNAYQWNQTTPDAYMTWYNWAYSVSTSNYNWAFTTTVDNAKVPEPATLALLGLGLAGLSFSRRKNKD